MKTVLRRGELRLLRDALQSWPDIPPPPADASTPLTRVLGAAALAASDPARVGAADLAVLVRHVLRAAAEQGDRGLVRLPIDPPWPNADELERHGLIETDADTAWRQVGAEPWQPEWMGTVEDPSAAILAGKWARPRHTTPIPADPFFRSLTGFETYRSPGQREAVRTLLASPPGSAVIGALPTGSGKSVVAYLHALESRGAGLTAVVVPTTSLALDQERAFAELIASLGRRGDHPAELAYYGELQAGARQAIRDRIRSGEQRIVFTSPESAVQSLSPALFDAAAAGRLRLFAVDEAHIVSEWGADFRPAFQALGALQRGLADAQGAERRFRTLMLSGTLTDEGIATLTTIFGAAEQAPLIVPAIDLRAEPGYWVHRAPTTDERTEHVLDAVRHLPRPLILYTTRVDHAQEWWQRLERVGFKRCELVIGETRAAERRAVIDRLRSGDADLVVATSAFGLGVDQPDVRCVVHACLPETLNRWYQEVGRGGRDGNPSLAVLISTPADDEIAQSLASTRLISLDRGRQRWEEMMRRAEPIGSDRFRLPLFVSPPNLKGDNDENRRWNLRLLLLMDRAGLIVLESTAPPRLDEGASEDEWEAAFEEHAKSTVVQVLHGGLAHDDAWARHFNPTRDAVLAADKQAHRRMRSALRKDARLCHLFADTYTIDDPRGDGRLRPLATCATCPGCRADDDPPTFFAQASPQPVRGSDIEWDRGLRQRFSGTSVLVLPYDGRDWPRDVERAVVRLVGLGARSVYGPREIRSWDELNRVGSVETPVFTDDRRWQRRDAPDLPTAVIHRPGEPPTHHELADSGPERVILADATVRHPDHRVESIGAYAPAVLSLDRFLADF
jgi:ATP-dependent DNA helicase RecQ